MAMDDIAITHLARCVALAREAREAGDEPFGSVLVGADGTVLFEDRNRVGAGDETRHPEFTIVEWAVKHLSPADRATATVYTSGEHCPMCAAAHAWVGLGPIVYAASSAQLTTWRTGWGLDASPVAALPIATVAPGIPTSGPFARFTEELKALHDPNRQERG